MELLGVSVARRAARTLNRINSAILRYTGADDNEPITVQTNFDLLREENLVVRPSLLRAIERVITNNSIFSLLSRPMYDTKSFSSDVKLIFIISTRYPTGSRMSRSI